MALVRNWRAVLTRAWSMWGVYIGLVIGVAEFVVPALGGIIPSWIYLALLLGVGIARLLKQPKVVA